jgi:hypothetical protein
LGRDGLAASTPCSFCTSMMKNLIGIKKVTYIDVNGEIISKKVNNIENYISSGVNLTKSMIWRNSPHLNLTKSEMG